MADWGDAGGIGSAVSIDIFIRTTRLLDPLRQAMFDATRVRWDLEPDVRVQLIRDQGIREGRMLAEEWTHSDPYIVTDDDVLIVGKDWVKRGLEAFCGQSEYALCSTLSLIEGENLCVPPLDSGPIYECHAVGAPMWVKKGILTEMPEMTLDQECGILHKYVLDKGYKEGLIKGLRHSHLGHGFSSNPILHWGY